MILIFDETSNKFFQIPDDTTLKPAPYVTLADAAKKLGITKQGVTRRKLFKTNVIKSIDGKRAIPVEELENYHDD